MWLGGRRARWCSKRCSDTETKAGGGGTSSSAICTTRTNAFYFFPFFPHGLWSFLTEPASLPLLSLFYFFAIRCCDTTNAARCSVFFLFFFCSCGTSTHKTFHLEFGLWDHGWFTEDKKGEEKEEEEEEGKRKKIKKTIVIPERKIRAFLFHKLQAAHWKASFCIFRSCFFFFFFFFSLRCFFFLRYFRWFSLTTSSYSSVGVERKLCETTVSWGGAKGVPFSPCLSVENSVGGGGMDGFDNGDTFACSPVNKKEDGREGVCVCVCVCSLHKKKKEGCGRKGGVGEQRKMNKNNNNAQKISPVS